MKSIKILNTICFLPLFFLITSCGSLVKQIAVSQITVEKNAIPPEFGQEETVLICLITGKKRYDKYIKKHVINEYKGRYEFVLKEELKSAKFEDVSEYRFVFSLSNSYYTTTSYNTATRNRVISNNTTSSCFIRDRKNKVTYKSPMTTSFFAKLIQGYMINLEKERFKK